MSATTFKIGTGLYLTSRTQTSKVPKLAGMSKDAAISELQRSNLKVGKSSPIINSTCKVDTVISSSPVGATYPINVSVAGPTAVTLPRS